VMSLMESLEIVSYVCSVLTVVISPLAGLSYELSSIVANLGFLLKFNVNQMYWK